MINTAAMHCCGGNGDRAGVEVSDIDDRGDGVLPIDLFFFYCRCYRCCSSVFPVALFWWWWWCNGVTVIYS